MTVSEIAKKYQLSQAWVRRLAEDGKLPGAKQLGESNIWLIPIEAIEAYIANKPKRGRKPKAQ